MSFDEMFMAVKWKKICLDNQKKKIDKISYQETTVETEKEIKKFNDVY